MRLIEPAAGEPLLADAQAELRSQGWALFPGRLSEVACDALSADLERVQRLCEAVQTRNGVAAGMQGTAHHVFGYGGALDDFIEPVPLLDQIERWFAGKVILLNYGGVLNRPGDACYTAKPHRDVRAFSPGYPLSLNMLVMLDAFTPENGATWVAPGSHRQEPTPSPEGFARNAVQVTGRRGDIVLFDSLLVHKTGENRTDQPRRALTLCFGRPFMKPHVDWLRYVPAARHGTLGPTARQLLGFHARVPASLEEYYQPAERWAFRADQR